MAWLWRQVTLSSILLLHLISGVISNEEGDVLTSFRSNMEDPNNVLKDWDSSLVSPCTWAHIICTNDNVTKIDLGNSALSGTLTSQIGLLKNLQILELYNNNIGGIIPGEIGNLSNLVSLDLYSNNFSGQIPETLGKLKKLLFLRINNNKLDGPIPRSLTNISELQFLNLSNNNLSGEVPTTGPFSRFPRTSFANNPLLCGPATMVQCPGAPPFSPPPQLIPPSTFSSSGKSASKTGTIIGGVAASIALFFVAPAIGIVWWYRRKKEECFFDVPAEDEAEVQLGQMKIYSFGELQVATDDFSDKNIVGKGGFGTVYEGRLADGSHVAVKKLKERGTSNEKLQFQREVEMFSRAVHRNLLRLRGYCMTSKELLLVYPFMANGSVASCLKERLPSKSPLDWATRKHIALGSARGLSYMHDHCDPKIIHRDVKAANILLDEEFEAVVGDFGLARLMDYNDTHVFTNVQGTVGHIPPEYLLTHKFSEKTDVYGYGVMLLELITGQRGSYLAHNAMENGFTLADWVNTQLEEKRLNRIVDPDLEANYIDIEVEEVIQVALLCIERVPEERPKMSEVVRMLEGSGLAKRWERRQKVKVVQEEEFYSQYLGEQIRDSTYILSAEKLSGPR